MDLVDDPGGGPGGRNHLRFRARAMYEDFNFSSRHGALSCPSAPGPLHRDHRRCDSDGRCLKGQRYQPVKTARLNSNTGCKLAVRCLTGQHLTIATDALSSEVSLDESALGFLLRALREERGLRLREVGQLAEVDHAYIYRLETGAKESPSEEVLSRLIRALKAGKREARMLRFLAEHPGTDAALVKLVLADNAIGYNVFAAVAGIAFRGTARPDYAKQIELVCRIMDEANGDR